MITKHPSSQARLKKLAERFLRLKDEHRRAERQMWAGMLALNFTTDELKTLSDYLAPSDDKMLAQIRGYCCAFPDGDIPDNDPVLVNFPKKGEGSAPANVTPGV